MIEELACMSTPSFDWDWTFKSPIGTGEVRLNQLDNAEQEHELHDNILTSTIETLPRAIEEAVTVGSSWEIPAMAVFQPAVRKGNAHFKMPDASCVFSYLEDEELTTVLCSRESHTV